MPETTSGSGTPARVHRLAALCAAGAEARRIALREVEAAVPQAEEGADEQAPGGVTRDWVVVRLREVAERCLQAVPPPPAKAGDAPGVWKFDAAGAIRALNLLGKQLGMFSERVEHQVSVHEDALEELE